MNYVMCASVLIRYVALVFCARAVMASVYNFSRFSDGTLACSLRQPACRVPLQPTAASAGCVAAGVRCAWMCTQDSRCTSFNLREDLERCDLFYDLSTTCAVIPGCFHAQVDSEADCAATVCAPGFVYDPTVLKCYRLLLESLNQSAANRRCHDLFPGAHLAMIADATEQTAVANFLDSMFSASSNFGVCEAFDSGNAVWTSGVANPNSSDGTYLWNPAADVYYPVNYTNFYSYDQQRSSHGKSDGPVCISMLQEHYSQWSGASCALQICGLCEYEPKSMHEDESPIYRMDSKFGSTDVDLSATNDIQ